MGKVSFDAPDLAFGTPGENIRGAVLSYMDGHLAIHDSKSGDCLKVTRQLVQAGLGWDYDFFYEVFHSHPVEDEPEGAKWARSAMRSLREQGRRVAFSDTEPIVFSEVQPGDVLCSWKVGGPIGHISLALSGGKDALMIENTSTQRGVKISNFNRLSRLDERPFPESWEAFRL